MQLVKKLNYHRTVLENLCECSPDLGDRRLNSCVNILSSLEK